jgi:hypothetical protein
MLIKSFRKTNVPNLLLLKLLDEVAFFAKSHIAPENVMIKTSFYINFFKFVFTTNKKAAYDEN